MNTSQITRVARLATSIQAEVGGDSDSSALLPAGPLPRSSSEQQEVIDIFDERIIDIDLIAVSRPRLAADLYADAVEAGIKFLCAFIRQRTGRTEDGDALMTISFSPKAPLLRVNSNRSKSEENEQRGHMLLCQGVVSAWRNPRAHSIVEDDAIRAILMLQMIQELLIVTRGATRTRQPRAGARRHP